MEYELIDRRFRAWFYLRPRNRFAIKLEYPEELHAEVREALKGFIQRTSDKVSSDVLVKSCEGDRVHA